MYNTGSDARITSADLLICDIIWKDGETIVSITIARFTLAPWLVKLDVAISLRHTLVRAG